MGGAALRDQNSTGLSRGSLGGGASDWGENAASWHRVCILRRELGSGQRRREGELAAGAFLSDGSRELRVLARGACLPLLVVPFYFRQDVSMKTLHLTFLAVLFGFLGSAIAPPRASAAELHPEHVPADAKWLLYYDVEQILGSKLIEEAREARPDLAKALRQWFEGQYGVDPRQDLRSVTLFSRSYRSYTGTVILHADYDPRKVEADLRKNDTLSTETWQGKTLYTVTLAKHRHGQGGGKRAGKHDRSGGKQMTIVLADEETIVLASSRKTAKQTLRLLAGDAPSHASQPQASQLLAGDWQGAAMYGAAVDLEAVEKSKAPLPVLSQHERITWTFRGRDGMLSEEARLVAKSPQVAKQVEQMVRGIVAYERLWAGDSKPLNTLIDGVSISREGKQVHVRWKAKNDVVLNAIDDLQKRFAHWKPAWTLLASPNGS